MYTLYAVIEDFVRRFGSREGLQANWRQLLHVASPSSQARLTNEGETAEAGGASQGVLYLISLRTSPCSGWRARDAYGGSGLSEKDLHLCSTNPGPFTMI